MVDLTSRPNCNEYGEDMPLTLKKKKLVITGTFEGIDPEDLHWDLVSMGASVHKSVTKTTAALIAGDAPELKHLKAAKKHGTPIVDRAGLDALIDRASLDLSGPECAGLFFGGDHGQGRVR